jgi:hypothetical protein
MLDSRLIRYQFRRTGLVHLTTCLDDDASGYHLTVGPTLCGKTVHIGQGGWGYGKPCPTCWSQGAPAEKVI